MFFGGVSWYPNMAVLTLLQPTMFEDAINITLDYNKITVFPVLVEMMLLFKQFGGTNVSWWKRIPHQHSSSLGNDLPQTTSGFVGYAKPGIAGWVMIIGIILH